MTERLAVRIACIFTAAAMTLSLSSCAAQNSMRNAWDSLKTAVRGTDTADDNTDSTEGEETADEVSNDITLGLVDFDTLNPLMTKSQPCRDICGFIYEPLFTVDSSLRPTGVLAESISREPDGKIISVKLKEGVRWHDGSELTADDVIYTVRAIMAGGTEYGTLIRSVDGVWKNDSYTVCFSFDHPVPSPENLLIFPIVKNNSLYSAGQDFGPIGTGPFVLMYSGGIRWLEAFEEHHDGRAKLDRINIKSIPDKEKYLTLFNANEIDVSGSEMQDMSVYMPKSNANVSDFVSDTMVVAGFNTTLPKLSDAATRQAISRLIDRDAITSNIYYSRAVSSEYALRPGAWLSFETRKRLRSDSWEAGQFLSNAGWRPDRRGVYNRPNGKGVMYLTVSILVNSDSEARVAIAESIAEWLNKDGIIAKVEKCPGADFNSRIESHNYEMFIGEIEVLPNNDMRELVGSQGNYFGYADEEMDTLLWQMGTVQGEEDIVSVSNRLFEYIRTEVPFAPICFIKKSLVTSAKLKSGYSPSAAGYIRNTENWSVK